MNRLGEEYPELIQHVLFKGNLVPSRIGDTQEIRDLRLRLHEPMWCLIDRPGMSDAFMYEEILQLLAGVHDNARIAAIVERAAELIAAPTAYGPRVYPQLEWICQELETSPSSRRAVTYVGRHDDLGVMFDPDEAKARAGEMPCTCLWQFSSRDPGFAEPRLDMSVYMRSWDLVWGLSYDVPSFVAVQMAVAEHLGLEIGTYTHTSGSAHIYERHFNLVPSPRYETLDLGTLLGQTIQQTRINARVAVGLSPGMIQLPMPVSSE